LKFLVQKQLNPRLWILTHEAQTVTGNEANLNSVQSLLLGFGKVIALEHPEFRCVRIDYDDSITLEILLNELTSDSPEDEIAIRKNKRYVPRLIHYTPEMQNTLNISAEGSYLITGGLGGLGLTCVDWLIAKGAKHLILTGRSTPKETAQTKFTAYREQGVEIIVQQADVSQKSDVEILFHRIKEMQRPLTGIMHAAGVSLNNNIINQTPEQFEKVLLPKVNGTQNLDEEVRKGKINLDFFLLFSSVSGALGSASTSSYTAANYFLNEYAKRGRRECLPFISISWGPWSSVGMASEEAEKELRLGYELISPENGVKAMEIALEGTEICPIVAPMNWPRYFDNLQYVGRIYSNIQLGLEKSTIITRDELGLSLESASQETRGKIALEYARKIIKQVLGLSPDEKIDDKKGFFEMGMDSLMTTELRNKLQNALGDRCVLRPTIAFDYPNLVELNEEILKQLGYKEDLASFERIKPEEIIEQEIDKKVDEMSIEDVLKKLKE
jgi:NADP-dependent 3-hydroxy acid dehydrogenase YdfG/acyl carrier protein